MYIFIDDYDIPKKGNTIKKKNCNKRSNVQKEKDILRRQIIKHKNRCETHLQWKTLKTGNSFI